MSDESHRKNEAADADVPRAKGSRLAVTVWAVVGLICATAPAWLFAWVGLGSFGGGGVGPRTATLTFAVPVVLSTVLAIWIAVRLARRDERRIGLVIGWITLVIGVIAYAAWIYLATLGIQFGDGPF